jgi:hypothetical protein
MRLTMKVGTDYRRSLPGPLPLGALTAARLDHHTEVWGAIVHSFRHLRVNITLFRKMHPVIL